MAKSPYKDRMRVTIDMPNEVFKTMKLITVEQNCTMTKWMVRAIVEKIQKSRIDESDYVIW